MKFLTNIDLNQNELQNAVVQPLATAPTGKLGQIYYNSTSRTLYQHDGTQWVAVGVTYDLSLGDPSDNAVPIILAGTDGSYDFVRIKGLDGIDIETSSDAEGYYLGISSSMSPIEYTFSGAASATGYTVTITPSEGSAQTITIPLATASDAGLLSPSDYNKLQGIQTGAEVNQNAFTRVIANGVAVEADAKEDTLNLSAGSNVQLSADASNDTVTISATDTTYTKGTQSQLEAGSDTTGQVWDSKTIHDYFASVIGGADAMRFKGTLSSPSEIPSTNVQTGDTYMINTSGTYAGQVCEPGDLLIAIDDTPSWTVAQTNINGAITSITGTSPVSVTGSGASRNISVPEATTSSKGLMSASDKEKISKIDVGDLTIPSSGTAASTGAVVKDIIAYTATLSSAGEQVMVDMALNNSTHIATFSIAQAYSEAISIRYLYMPL